MFYYVRGVCQEMMWSASVLLRARSVSRNDVSVLLREECEMMWSASVSASVLLRARSVSRNDVVCKFLRARSVSRNDVVCKCFITCEECVKK